MGPVGPRDGMNSSLKDLCVKQISFWIYTWLANTSRIEYITTIVWPHCQFMVVCLAHKYFKKWIYPIPGPNRAHRHKLKCISLQLFCLQVSYWIYAWHKSTFKHEFIPSLGTTGPTVISQNEYHHNYLASKLVYGYMLYTKALLDMNISHPWAWQGPQI